MFRILALVLVLSAVAYGDVPGSDVGTGRIAGGVDAEISEVPWMLSLRWNEVHLCGAALISSTWAVSAAQCTYFRNTAHFTIRAGSNNRFTGGQMRQVSVVIIHPEYRPSTLDNDICLIRVAVAFTLNANVRVVPLPTQDQFVHTGSYGVVSGWGALHHGGFWSTILQLVWVPIVAQATCDAAYPTGVSDNMICAGYWAGGKDSCQGDAGGPLVVSGTLIGIVSWGDGCAFPKLPGVYARVPVHRNWIKTHTGV